MSQRIRIGNQTACSAAQTMDPFNFAIESRFDAFEWFSDKKNGHGFSEGDFDAGARGHLRKTGELHDVRYSVHAPWQANPLHGDGSTLLYNSVDFAHDIGADIMNLHLYMDKGPEEYVRALLPVIQHASKKGVRVSIENTPITPPAEFNETFAAFWKSGVSRKDVGMCLDIGHANICDQTRFDYVRYLDELSPEVPIIHLHLHENYGDADTHLTLFSGPAGENDAGVRAFLERLRKRKYEGAMILEQWPNPSTQLLKARARLRMLLELQN
jgi:sugar phosphate isomerase/epimerase